MKQKTPAIYFEIPDDLRKAVQAKAAKEDKFLREIMIALLKEWVKK
jgi:hypothetical protein